MNTRVSEWKGIDWQRVNIELKLLQAKLYKALKDNASSDEIRKIHNTIITSFSARAYAIRKITSSKGRKTPGIDGKLYTTDEQKWEAIKLLKAFNRNTYRAKPVKRVWIPKGDGTLRPLGIPAIYDRAVQTLYSFILDVHQENTANARSFGFRRGRSAKQAIEYAWLLSSGKKRFIMAVDVKKAYGSVSHQWLRSNLPISRTVIEQWLKAGVLDKSQLSVDHLESLREVLFHRSYLIWLWMESKTK